MPRKPPFYMDENIVPWKLPKFPTRKKKLKGNKEDFCHGFFDVHGQWNNGFFCPIWSPNVNQVYCCGEENDRYCCKPGDQSSVPGLTTYNPSDKPAANTESSNQRELTKLPASPANNCIFDCGISNIAALTISVTVLLSLVMLVLCWVCPRYMKYRNRKKAVQKVTDSLGFPRTLVANTSGMTLIYQLQPMTSSMVGQVDLHQPIMMDANQNFGRSQIFPESEPSAYQIGDVDDNFRQKKWKFGMKKNSKVPSEVLTNFSIMPALCSKEQSNFFGIQRPLTSINKKKSRRNSI
ncbi:Hypothetical predicted protein [Octopus vulgaris]|uniref:Shisa N-terminal domain-containing protein n=1 Tax=Octopus vulgaris TaxID=6645 RepID=A0AA36BPA7_OCTVU|nr:Hypothetical predicted protein [Octopus vulgaris]